MDGFVVVDLLVMIAAPNRVAVVASAGREGPPPGRCAVRLGLLVFKRIHGGLSQSASASSSGEIVCVTLRVVLPGHGPRPVPVRAPMSWKLAQELADQLRHYSLEAEMFAAQKS